MSRFALALLALPGAAAFPLALRTGHRSAPVITRKSAPLLGHVAGETHRTLPPTLLAAAEEPAGSEGALLPGWVTTGALIALWYATSIVCNQSIKTLLSTTALGEQGLTLAQMVISTMCGAFGLFALRATEYRPLRSRAQWRDTAYLAAAFTAGFGTLNACVGAMHVSLVMVLRAAEPVTTLALGYALLPAAEAPSALKTAALVPVVAGAALSSVGAHAPTALGLCLALASNVCFSLRGILSKRLSSGYTTDAYSQFFQLSAMGAAIQAALLLAGAAGGVALPSLPAAAQLPTLLVNGASFFAYLQLSWVVLGRGASSHLSRPPVDNTSLPARTRVRPVRPLPAFICLLHPAPRAQSRR